MKQQSQHYMPPLIMTRLTIHCLLLSLYIILITMAMSGIIYILLQKCRVLNAINSKKSVNQLEAETILGIQVRDGWEVEEGGVRWQMACDLLYCVVLFVAKTFYLKNLACCFLLKINVTLQFLFMPNIHCISMYLTPIKNFRNSSLN